MVENLLHDCRSSAQKAISFLRTPAADSRTLKLLFYLLHQQSGQVRPAAEGLYDLCLLLLLLYYHYTVSSLCALRFILLRFKYLKLTSISPCSVQGFQPRAPHYSMKLLPLELLSIVLAWCDLAVHSL